MKNLTLILVLTTSFFSFGQSAKKENVLLRGVLDKAKKNYDSCAAIYLDQFAQLEKSRIEVRSILRNIDDLKRKNTDLKKSIEKNNSILTALGFDVNSIIPLSEFKSLENIYLPTIPQYPERLFNEVFYYKAVHDTLKLDGLKMKAQNALLDKQIAIYSNVESNNSGVIQREMLSVQDLKAIANSLNVIQTQLELQHQSFWSKDLTLQLKLTELKENYRTKGPKGFSEAYREQFPELHRVADGIAPQLMEKNTYDNVKEDDGEYYMDAIAPPPPPEPVFHENNEIFEMVEESAEFPGGKAALLDYLAQNIQYPQVAIENEISGKVYLRFVVSEKGNISNVKVVKGLPNCKECDYEALRLVKNMPLWKPAKNGGRAVNSWFTMPIQFKSI